MNDDDLALVREMRERQLLREYDRASALAAKLRSQLALVEKARQDVIAQMRELAAEGEVSDGAAR